MESVGLGDVVLRVSLGGLSYADLARVTSVTMLLRSPTGGVTEIPVPTEQVDRIARVATVRYEIAVRGTYRLSCRLGFEGGTSITARSASSFTANDGMG